MTRVVRLQTIDLLASGNRRHDGDIITIFHCRSIFLQVADVFVVEIHIHESTQFAFIRIEMAAQIRMLRHQFGQRPTHRCGFQLHRGMFSGILAQRRRNVDLSHG